MASFYAYSDRERDGLIALRQQKKPDYEQAGARLLATIGPFPARDLIRGWLKAGVFEPGKGFAPTEEGTPQGGVISPLLLNVALHGLEEAAGVRYAFPGTGSGQTQPGSPVVIRYADDLVALCHSGE